MGVQPFDELVLSHCGQYKSWFNRLKSNYSTKVAQNVAQSPLLAEFWFWNRFESMEKDFLSALESLTRRMESVAYQNGMLNIKNAEIDDERIDTESEEERSKAAKTVAKLSVDSFQFVIIPDKDVADVIAAFEIFYSGCSVPLDDEREGSRIPIDANRLGDLASAFLHAVQPEISMRAARVLAYLIGVERYRPATSIPPLLLQMGLTVPCGNGSGVEADKMSLADYLDGTYTSWFKKYAQSEVQGEPVNVGMLNLSLNDRDIRACLVIQQAYALSAFLVLAGPQGFNTIVANRAPDAIPSIIELCRRPIRNESVAAYDNKVRMCIIESVTIMLGYSTQLNLDHAINRWQLVPLLSALQDKYISDGYITQLTDLVSFFSLSSVSPLLLSLTTMANSEQFSHHARRCILGAVSRIVGLTEYEDLQQSLTGPLFNTVVQGLKADFDRFKTFSDDDGNVARLVSCRVEIISQWIETSLGEGPGGIETAIVNSHIVQLCLAFTSNSEVVEGLSRSTVEKLVNITSLVLQLEHARELLAETDLTEYIAKTCAVIASDDRGKPGYVLNTFLLYFGTLSGIDASNGKEVAMDMTRSLLTFLSRQALGYPDNNSMAHIKLPEEEPKGEPLEISEKFPEAHQVLKDAFENEFLPTVLNLLNSQEYSISSLDIDPWIDLMRYMLGSSYVLPVKLGADVLMVLKLDMSRKSRGPSPSLEQYSPESLALFLQLASQASNEGCFDEGVRLVHCPRIYAAFHVFNVFVPSVYTQTPNNTPLQWSADTRAKLRDQFETYSDSFLPFACEIIDALHREYAQFVTILVKLGIPTFLELPLLQHMLAKAVSVYDSSPADSLSLLSLTVNMFSGREYITKVLAVDSTKRELVQFIEHVANAGDNDKREAVAFNCLEFGRSLFARAVANMWDDPEWNPTVLSMRKLLFEIFGFKIAEMANARWVTGSLSPKDWFLYLTEIGKLSEMIQGSIESVKYTIGHLNLAELIDYQNTFLAVLDESSSRALRCDQDWQKWLQLADCIVSRYSTGLGSSRKYDVASKSYWSTSEHGIRVANLPNKKVPAGDIDPKLFTPTIQKLALGVYHAVSNDKMLNSASFEILQRLWYRSVDEGFSAFFLPKLHEIAESGKVDELLHLPWSNMFVPELIGTGYSTESHRAFLRATLVLLKRLKPDAVEVTESSITSMRISTMLILQALYDDVESLRIGHEIVTELVTHSLVKFDKLPSGNALKEYLQYLVQFLTLDVRMDARTIKEDLFRLEFIDPCNIFEIEPAGKFLPAILGMLTLPSSALPMLSGCFMQTDNKERVMQWDLVERLSERLYSIPAFSSPQCKTVAHIAKEHIDKIGRLVAPVGPNHSAHRMINELVPVMLSPSSSYQSSGALKSLIFMVEATAEAREILMCEYPSFVRDALLYYGKQSSPERLQNEFPRGLAHLSRLLGNLVSRSHDEAMTSKSLESLASVLRWLTSQVKEILEKQVLDLMVTNLHEAGSVLHACVDVIAELWTHESAEVSNAWAQVIHRNDPSVSLKTLKIPFKQHIILESGIVDVLFRCYFRFDPNSVYVSRFRHCMLCMMEDMIRQDSFKVVYVADKDHEELSKQYDAGYIDDKSNSSDASSNDEYEDEDDIDVNHSNNESDFDYDYLQNDEDSSTAGLTFGSDTALRDSNVEDEDFDDDSLAAFYADERERHRRRIVDAQGNVFRNSVLGDYESGSSSEGGDSVMYGDDGIMEIDDDLSSGSDESDAYIELDDDDMGHRHTASGHADGDDANNASESGDVDATDDHTDDDDDSDDGGQPRFQIEFIVSDTEGRSDNFMDSEEINVEQDSGNEIALDGIDIGIDDFMSGLSQGVDFFEGLLVRYQVGSLELSPAREGEDVVGHESDESNNYIYDAFRGAPPNPEEPDPAIPADRCCSVVNTILVRNKQALEEAVNLSIQLLCKHADPCEAADKLFPSNIVEYLPSFDFASELKSTDDKFNLLVTPLFVGIFLSMMFTDIFEDELTPLKKTAQWVLLSEEGRTQMLYGLMHLFINASQGNLDLAYTELQNKCGMFHTSSPETVPDTATASLTCSNVLNLLNVLVSPNEEDLFEDEREDADQGISNSVLEQRTIKNRHIKKEQEDLVQILVSSYGKDLIALLCEPIIADNRRLLLSASSFVHQVMTRDKSEAVEKFELGSQTLTRLVNVLGSKQCSSGTFNNIIAIVRDNIGMDDVLPYIVKEARRAKSSLMHLLPQMAKIESGLDVLEKSGTLDTFVADQVKILRLFNVLQNGCLNAGQYFAALQQINVFPLWNKIVIHLQSVRQHQQTLGFATSLALLEMIATPALAVLESNDYSQQQYGHLIKSVDEFVKTKLPPHKVLINEFLRTRPHLLNGSLGSISQKYGILDFHNKYEQLQVALSKMKQSHEYRPLTLTLHRDNVLNESFDVFASASDNALRGPLNIRFINEQGVDAGGVAREWLEILSRAIVNPNYGLFAATTLGSSVYQISPLSSNSDDLASTLEYFRFVGRIVGRAIWDSRTMGSYFSRALYKYILGAPVTLSDMESIDEEYYKSLLWMLENDITDIIFETFSVDVTRFGRTETINLIPAGADISVTEENKRDYVQKIVQYKLVESVDAQLKALKQGVSDILDLDHIKNFNEQELELLISGMPDIDVLDWQANTWYVGFTESSPQVKWFWLAVRSFTSEERAKLLQFCTGTSRVPVHGFRHLESNESTGKFSIQREHGSSDRLPSSHTCMNQLIIPEYENYKKLRTLLLRAITEGNEGFGFA